MSNFKKTIEIIKPYFEGYGFSLKKKSIFYKEIRNSYESFFYIQSYQSGYSTHLIFGIDSQKLNDVIYKTINFSPVYTIFLREEVCFYNNNNNRLYSNLSLESDYEIEKSIRTIKEIYNEYAIPFYTKNNSLTGVLKSLREIDGIAIPLGNLVHSLMANEAMALDLFLTRLLYGELDFKTRSEYYRETILNLSKQHKIEKGIDGAYMHLIEKLDIESNKIVEANWDDIKESLADLF